MSEVIIKSHLGEIQKAFNERAPIIMEAVGLEAEGNAISNVRDMKAVDTGRLKNSITHGVSGKPFSKPTYSDDQSNTYAGPSGPAPGSTSNETIAVYIGSNVEYSPYVELGTYKMASRPFLRNAINDHLDDYKRILQDGLK